MSELSEFLKKKKEQSEKKAVDWETVKKEWLQQLNELITQIKGWVHEPANEGLLEVKEEYVELHEENIGKYKAPALRLKIGEDSVKVTPVGRLIIGARGRVDVSSYLGKYMLLYTSEKGWLCIKENKQGGYHDLNERTFTKILKDLLS